jgi:hypothetical protein
VREENLGSTRKFIDIYLLFTFIINLILALHTESEWAGGTFLRQRKKSSSPCAVGVFIGALYLEEHSEGNPYKIYFSVPLSVWNTKTHRIFM